jgi:hypothetical protein
MSVAKFAEISRNKIKFYCEISYPEISYPFNYGLMASIIRGDKTIADGAPNSFTIAGAEVNQITDSAQPTGGGGRGPATFTRSLRLIAPSYESTKNKQLRILVNSKYVGPCGYMWVGGKANIKGRVPRKNG